MSSEQHPPPSTLPRWLTFGVAVIAIVLFALLLNDLRLEFKRTAVAVNENLPEILDKTRKSADTLAELSEDIKQLRDLAGATGPRDRSLVAYADAVLDAVEKSGGTIGLKSRIGREALRDTQPAMEWVTAARKEALWLTFNAKSKEELLTRLCETKFGSEWHIELPNQEPLALKDWLEKNAAVDSAQ